MRPDATDEAYRLSNRDFLATHSRWLQAAATIWGNHGRHSASQRRDPRPGVGQARPSPPSPRPISRPRSRSRPPNTTASSSRWSTIRGTSARCAIASSTCSTARQIAKSGSLAPAVTPMVRIPPNGVEKAQWQAKQALDLGAYGIVWPHISIGRGGLQRGRRLPLSAPEDGAALRARRHPRRRPDRGGALLGPDRSRSTTTRADVWPLNPKGEIFVILMIEDTARHREPPRHPQEGAGHRRDPDRRRRPLAGARLSAPIRAPGSARVDGAGGRHLQEAQRGRSVIRTSTATMSSASSRRATAS